MPADPALDLANWLAAGGIGLTVGTNLFVGPVRPVSTGVPAQSVFVVATGGRGPGRVLGTSTEVRYASVQVRVRSSGLQAGLALAKNVYTRAESGAVTGYLTVVAIQSEPMFIEQDENNNYHWSLNFEMAYQE